MNISGVLVQTLPQNAASLQSRLTALPGVEVHAVSAEGGLVVTIEAPSSRTMADTLSHVQGMSEVLSATLIYHHHDQSAGSGLGTQGDPEGVKHRDVFHHQSDTCSEETAA